MKVTSQMTWYRKFCISSQALSNTDNRDTSKQPGLGRALVNKKLGRFLAALCLRPALLKNANSTMFHASSGHPISHEACQHHEKMP